MSDTDAGGMRTNDGGYLRRRVKPRADKPDTGPARHCEHCGTQLKRHRDQRTNQLETAEKWERRRFCNRDCANRDRGSRAHKAIYDSIAWEPIIADPPKYDQCWAGFVAGHRCVLRRGGHVMHRDATGREFVKADPRPASPTVERAPSVPTSIAPPREWSGRR